MQIEINFFLQYPSAETTSLSHLNQVYFPVSCTSLNTVRALLLLHPPPGTPAVTALHGSEAWRSQHGDTSSKLDLNRTKMHRIPSLLSHAQSRDPLLQLPRVPGSCHKHVLHTHKNTEEGNQRIQEHLTSSFKQRKASFKQELLTPCASPSLHSWEQEASPAHRKDSLEPPIGTRPVPSSSSNTRSCPSHNLGL